MGSGEVSLEAEIKVRRLGAMPIDYTVTTEKDFPAAVQAVQEKCREKGFRVLHVHDVQATLAEKGFTRKPFKIIEICNAKYAHQALTADERVGLLMPCKINVYTLGGQTRISAIRPSILSQMLPGTGLEEMAGEVEEIIRSIVNEAR